MRFCRRSDRWCTLRNNNDGESRTQFSIVLNTSQQFSTVFKIIAYDDFLSIPNTLSFILFGENLKNNGFLQYFLMNLNEIYKNSPYIQHIADFANE